jgi:hypothetical protein
MSVDKHNFCFVFEENNFKDTTTSHEAGADPNNNVTSSIQKLNRSG